MSKIFVGGSRKITQLNSEIKQHIDECLAEQPNILIGDAHGADKAVQKYLAEQKYQNATVFCVNGFCRNNLGSWTVRIVHYDKKRIDFRGFIKRDEAMANEADRGIMLWDGQSKGTVNNVLNLLSSGKTSRVYLTPERRFVDIQNQKDLRQLLAIGDPEAIAKMDDQIKLTKRLAAADQGLLF